MMKNGKLPTIEHTCPYIITFKLNLVRRTFLQLYFLAYNSEKGISSFLVLVFRTNLDRRLGGPGFVVAIFCLPITFDRSSR